MWEEWRSEIDRSLRDAQLAQDKWFDHESRAALATKAEDDGMRLFDAMTLERENGRPDLPTSWRLRLGRSARPVL